jgi:hypothetical protein
MNYRTRCFVKQKSSPACANAVARQGCTCGHGPIFYDKNIKIASLFENITSEAFVTFSKKVVVPDGLGLVWLIKVW